jgi:acyl carrier protein
MSLSENDMEAEIRAFLTANAPNRADEMAALDRRARIWDAVDSLSLLELVEYIEQRFRIRVAPLDLLPENFATIENVVHFIRKQVQARPSQ